MQLTIPIWEAAPSAARPPVPWPRDVAGKTVALLDNSKDGAGVALDRVFREIAGGAKDVRVVRLRKPSAGVPMPEDVFERVRTADAVITGLAD